MVLCIIKHDVLQPTQDDIPPTPADCLLSSDQRLRDSVCGRVERGAGLGMSGAGTTQAAAWPSVPN